MKHKRASAYAPRAAAALDTISKRSFLTKNHIGGVKKLTVCVRVSAVNAYVQLQKTTIRLWDCILQHAAVQGEEISEERIRLRHYRWNWDVEG
jgi:hypothetical protein